MSGGKVQFLGGVAAGMAGLYAVTKLMEGRAARSNGAVRSPPFPIPSPRVRVSVQSIAYPDPSLPPTLPSSLKRTEHPVNAARPNRPPDPPPPDPPDGAARGAAHQGWLYGRLLP